MANLEHLYIVKISREFNQLIEDKKLKVSISDKKLLQHLLQQKVCDYGIVKLLDAVIVKNLDILNQCQIKYKPLSSNIHKEDKKIVKNIDIRITGDLNILEVRLPFLMNEKFNLLIQFLKNDLKLEFEKRPKYNNDKERIGDDNLWFSIIQNISIFEKLFKNELIKEIGYSVDKGMVLNAINKINESKGKQKALFKLSTMADFGNTIKFKGMFTKLYPFQQVSVEYSNHKQSIYIADEMGLGKTVQSLAIMEYHNLYPALILVPANLRKNWKKEINYWLPDKKVFVVEPQKKVLSGDIYVVSYSMISKVGELILKNNLKMLICDESHYLKSSEASRTKYVLKHLKSIPFKILITGTPILNRTIELVTQLDLLGILDNHFGGTRKFQKRYAPSEWTGFGWTYRSANEEELQVELRKSCMIRRMKKDVMKELPDKTRKKIYLPLSNRREYQKVETDSINWYEHQLKKQNLSDSVIQEKVNEKLKNRNFDVDKMIQVEYLRQAAVEYKMKAAFNWIDDTLIQVNKLVIFAHHRNIIEQLYAKYKDKAVMLYGGMSNKVDDIVNQFVNDDKIKLFIGSLQAAAVGIDGLQKVCDQLAFIEFAWTPAINSHAEDRLHRIGQFNAVNIYYLLAENTIEEYVYTKVIEKQEIFEKAININQLFKWIKSLNG